MTSSENSVNKDWRQHQDPVQSSVQFVIQWLAYLYPNCEPSIDEAILKAQPFVDTELKRFWTEFLETEPLEAHLDVLAWVGEQINRQQSPYLIQACWHLLLSKHQLPTLMPSAMRILQPVFSFEESELIRIGQRVRSELHADVHTGVYQLTSAKPEYVYQLEQKLLLESKLIHKMVRGTYTDRSLILSFSTGVLIGAALLWTVQHYIEDTPIDIMVSRQDPSAETAMITETQVAEVELAFPQINSEESTVLASTASEKTVEDIKPEPEPEPIKEIIVSKPQFKERLMEVTANVLNLRVGPDSSTEVISRLGKGAKVWQVGLSEDRRWALVQVNNFEGYVGVYFLKPSQGSGPEDATSTQTQ